MSLWARRSRSPDPAGATPDATSSRCSRADIVATDDRRPSVVMEPRPATVSVAGQPRGEARAFTPIR